ncbi:hypothetical protein BDQ17DRAFT_1432703 [Cyathus striatus]|nr:hypothetical protein BDQ17DRAFT_1432703 [Cyathus striatus]
MKSLERLWVQPHLVPSRISCHIDPSSPSSGITIPLPLSSSSSMVPTERFINKRGSQLISSMFNNVFYGIAMCMVVQYFIHHAYRDSFKTKLVVCLLVIFATLEVIFVNIQMFNILVLSFGKNMEVGGNIHYSVLGKYTSIFFTAFTAQMFYASRIWSSKFWLFRFGQPFERIPSWKEHGIHGETIETVGDSCGIFFISTARSTILSNIRRIATDWGRLPSHSDVPVTSADALPMLIPIHRQISVTFELLGLKTIQLTEMLPLKEDPVLCISRTDSLLENLIKYAIQRAAATSVCGVLTIFLYHYTKSTYFFNLPCLINAHFHVMSVISMLITRENLREKLALPHHVSDLVLATRVEGLEDAQTSSATLAQHHSQ